MDKCQLKDNLSKFNPDAALVIVSIKTPMFCQKKLILIQFVLTFMEMFILKTTNLVLVVIGGKNNASIHPFG